MGYIEKYQPHPIRRADTQNFTQSPLNKTFHTTGEADTPDPYLYNSL